MDPASISLSSAGSLALAGLFTLVIWIRRGEGHQRLILSAGIFLWACLGFHDLLATLGLHTVQFLLEYGFGTSSIAVLSVSLRHYLNLFEVAEQGEEHMAAEAERLAVTLRSIGEGFIATDAGGRIAMFNAAAAQISGWSVKEAIGRPLSEVYPALFSDRRRPLRGRDPTSSNLSRMSGAHDRGQVPPHNLEGSFSA